MKIPIALVVVVVLAWLVLWMTNTGILVWSEDTGILKTRDCRYLVGVTVLKRLQPIADRCPVFRSVGA
jgi:hypothetical protein